MGEIEGLDTHEPLPDRLERHAFDRLIMLSDGVFAIAITLAALEIRPGGRWSDLPGLWAAIRDPVCGYLVSFVVVSVYWISHRDLFARLRRVDGVLTSATLALLFGIALLPTTTRLIYSPAVAQGPATQLYLLNLAAIGAAQAVMWGYAGLRPGLMLAKVGWRYRAGRVVLALGVALGMLWVAAAGVHAQGRTNWTLIGGIVLVVAGGRRALASLAARRA